jgi:raffinose synthase
MPVAQSPLPARELASLPREGLPLVLGLRSAAGAAPRSTADAVVGALRCQRFLSCARNKLWWMTPEWGTEAAQLPGETQFLLVELGPEGKGPYGLLLPLISDGTFRATLRPAGGGSGAGVLGGLLGNGNNNR